MSKPFEVVKKSDVIYPLFVQFIRDELEMELLDI